MNILLKSAIIIDQNSEFHEKKVDLFIENGIIKNIEKNSTKKADQVIEHKDLYISPGWFDSSVNFGEPGFEERETIEHGLKVAAKSGFTAVGVNANLKPVTDNNSAVSFLFHKAKDNLVDLFPVGALTNEGKGEDLAELYDMKSAGAISFYDNKKPISNPNLLKIALQYTQNFKGLVQSFPMDNKIAGNATVNEHVTSTNLGLKGIPAMAEELQVARDLHLLKYTDGKLHIPTISTAGSVELIKEAKKKGLDVTCSVSIFNLYFDDCALNEFDTNYKLMPPLRTKEDIKSLRKALKEGVIDMVTSDHTPIDIEHKKVEFEHALYGSVGLEHTFKALLSIYSVEDTLAILSRGRSRFGIHNSIIKVDQTANITLVAQTEATKVQVDDILSTSKNSAFIHETLPGRIIGVMNNNQLMLN
ncbi:dihydroorotase [Gangjinia marincola]|uniref:Dihydroorotase n=1 Tax=Gangjinia marincola TaxID=578463 RepID=A0ABP3XRH9_9FLAO